MIIHLDFSSSTIFYENPSKLIGTALRCIFHGCTIVRGVAIYLDFCNQSPVQLHIFSFATVNSAITNMGYSQTYEC